jgi:hypothetical protein
VHLRAGNQIMAEQLCEDYHVNASQEVGCRSIDLMVPNKVTEVCAVTGKSAQTTATVPCIHVLCRCILLVALSIFQIGCREQSKNKFSFPEKPTPLPAPNDQIDMGAVQGESGQLLERSNVQNDEHTSGTTAAWTTTRAGVPTSDKPPAAAR